MTEAPRPPGAGDPGETPQDPTAPPPRPASSSTPGEASAPGYEPPAAPRYGTPGDEPTHQTPAAPPAGGYPPPGSDYPPPGGGAGYPPPGGYPPAGGYQGGGGYPGGSAPAGYPTNDDKTWALIAHFGGPVGVIVGGGVLGWVAPLIALMSKGQQSPIVRAHALAALNFQITWAIIVALSWVATAITCGVLFFIPAIIWLVPVIFGIIAGVKANDGVLYRYPVSYAFAKN